MKPSFRMYFPCALLLLLLLTSLLLGGRAASPRGRWVPMKPVVEEGEAVTLSCFLEGRPAADPHPTSYMWTKNDKVIPGKTGVNLTFTSVTRQDAGIYQCKNPHYNIEYLEFDLYVSGAPLPQPVVTFSGYEVYGRYFSLECLILRGYAHNDKTRYTWYKDGTEIQGQTSDILQFTRVNETDVGVYTCTAREGPVESTSPPSQAFHLVPLLPPEVRIKTTSADDVVKGILGENLTLTCEVTQAFPGVPDDSYSWSYLPSPQGQPRPLEGKASTLTLGPLTREDGGQYFCQARNDQLFERLTLTGNASVTVDIVYLRNISLTSDLEVDEGDPMTLTCMADSHPVARLVWTVHGQEVRHVTDNLDHYVILSARCSDSTSYTCRASNTDLPGREKTATFKVRVHCKQETADTTATEISATFDFRLPDNTSMVVVHPGGQNILTVQQDCSLTISSAFLPRCLRPRCDPARRHLSFTLTRVTEEDEGNYVCREEGEERRRIPDCGERFLLKKCVTNIPHLDNHQGIWFFPLVCFVLALGIFLVIKCRRRFFSFCTRVKFVRKTVQRLRERSAPVGHSHTEDAGQMKQAGLSFDELYKNGKTYVLPPLMAPKDKFQRGNVAESGEHRAPLFPQRLTDPGAQHIVKDLVRITLQETTEKEDLPSFLLHNTRLSRQENIILVLSRKMGVILMTVKAVEDVDELQSIDSAVTQLLVAREKVRKRLGGLVKPGAVTAVLALPNLTSSNMEDVRQHLEDAEVLLGQERADFQQWAEQLTSRPDNDVWNLDAPGVHSPDIAYKKAASCFLTLTGCRTPGESPGQPAAEESWLLTPAQLQVRDSTARRMHIWGPPGSGKTSLMIDKTREWLEEGKVVVLAMGKGSYDLRLAHIYEALRKGQDEETCRRIHVRRSHDKLQTTVNDLKDHNPNKDICLIIYGYLETHKFRERLSDQIKNLTYIWSASRHKPQNLDIEMSEQMLQLGWEPANLPDCIRCTENTMELLNLLVRGSPDLTPVPACSLPGAGDIPAWTVVDHCLHPQHTSTTSCCLKCKEEVSAVLPFLDGGTNWRDWIALHTGNIESTELQNLSPALRNVGIPVFFESGSYLQTYSETSSEESAPHRSNKEFAHFWRLIFSGKDETGQPTVHLLDCADFKGMEKEGVIVVHQDQRDDDPEHQGQEEREARLNQHRRQWFNAVSRSKGQVILLLLTPSPARTLLNFPESPKPQGQTRGWSCPPPARTAGDMVEDHGKGSQPAGTTELTSHLG